jgi:hypothetical protein
MHNALWQIERITRLELALCALKLAFTTLGQVFRGVLRAAVRLIPLHLTQLTLFRF